MITDSSQTGTNLIYGYMDGNVSNCFLFTIKPFEYYYILHIHTGKGTLTESHTPHEIQERQFVFVQPGTDLLLEATNSPVSFSLILIKSSLKNLPAFILFDENGSESLRLLKLLETNLLPQPFGTRSDILDTLLSAISQIHCKSNAKMPLQSAPPFIHMLKEILDTRYAEPLNLDDLSRELYINKYKLIREFKYYFGITPIDYLLSRRITQAAQLLRDTDIKVKDIGNQVGLPNPTYFTRAFAKKINSSPIQYRKQFHK